MSTLVKLRASIAESYKKSPILTAIIILLVIVLIVKLIKWVAVFLGLRESRFFTPGIGNFEINGDNSLWWDGGVNAGSGGSMDSALTAQQLGVFVPQLNRDYQMREAAKKQAMDRFTARKRKERMTSYDRGVCGEGWDPAAVAEAEGLDVAGGLQPNKTSYSKEAEKRLAEAANATYDTENLMTNAQIAYLPYM